MKKIGGRITMAELSSHDQKQILTLLDFKRRYKKARATKNDAGIGGIQTL